MSKKDMSDKLLGAVRSAKTHNSTPPAASPKPARLPSGGASNASSAGQTPVPNLDHPWENLHPERIWPD